MGTHTFLTEDDDKVTPFTKVAFGQDPLYTLLHVGGRIWAPLEGKSLPPVNREKEKRVDLHIRTGTKGKFLGYRSQNKYRLHFSTLYPELLPGIGNLLYLVCPLQSKHDQVHHKKEASGFCPGVNDILHAKTVPSLLDIFFLLKIYASPRREHQEHLQPF